MCNYSGRNEEQNIQKKFRITMTRRGYWLCVTILGVFLWTILQLLEDIPASYTISALVGTKANTLKDVRLILVVSEALSNKVKVYLLYVGFFIIA